MTQATQQPRPGRQGLVGRYRRPQGGFDEMLDADGTLRPGWRALIGAFEALGPELPERFERADQYLRDAGVFYRKYDEAAGKERDWPLAHVPLLIGGAEWATIAAGLAQRAALLESVVADIYGENGLVARGLLPPEMIARNPEFLRPMVGIRPASGRFLQFCAFELGRGPDGAWCVLGDRTQAPSGAGFALENRVATTRALPDISADMNVERLAGFFRDFRDSLLSQVTTQDGRVGILTPGQLNDTYFEHAYIARYLGFTLLEGDDMVVEDGRVMVRTVAGLRPVSVLWRRMDASFIDPLELRQDSRIGTPGMMDALRQGTVTMVNAPGTGILETRALSAFLPRLARHLLGSDLALPQIGTWWCGQPSERAAVLENFDTMLIGSAFSTALQLEDPRGTVLGGAMSPDQRETMRARILEEGANYVGQESVRLSTLPVYAEGSLVARPVTLRVYAARTETGWTVMPGGFARVGATDAADAVGMQRGGRAADVWVLSDTPVEPVSLLPRSGEKLVRNPAGSLPSRAADNLIWLGRYAERCEAIVRTLRAYNARLAEFSRDDQPILAHTRDLLETIDVDAREALPIGLLQAIDSAVLSASQIRDRFSPDGWLALDDLAKTAQRFAERVTPGNDATRAMTVLLRKLAGFSGLVHENMYRFAGWRFLELGRRLERGMQLARLVRWFTAEDAPDGSIEMLLEIADSVISHRRRYSVTSGPQSAIDLLVLDPLNPRSVIFQLAAIREQIEVLPDSVLEGHLSTTARLALSLETGLTIAEPQDMTNEDLETLEADVGRLAARLAADYCA